MTRSIMTLIKTVSSVVLLNVVTLGVDFFSARLNVVTPSGVFYMQNAFVLCFTFLIVELNVVVESVAIFFCTLTVVLLSVAFSHCYDESCFAA